MTVDKHHVEYTVPYRIRDRIHMFDRKTIPINCRRVILREYVYPGGDSMGGGGERRTSALSVKTTPCLTGHWGQLPTKSPMVNTLRRVASKVSSSQDVGV